MNSEVIWMDSYSLMNNSEKWLEVVNMEKMTVTYYDRDDIHSISFKIEENEDGPFLFEDPPEEE